MTDIKDKLVTVEDLAAYNAARPATISSGGSGGSSGKQLIGTVPYKLIYVDPMTGHNSDLDQYFMMPYSTFSYYEIDTSDISIPKDTDLIIEADFAMNIDQYSVKSYTNFQPKTIKFDLFDPSSIIDEFDNNSNYPAKKCFKVIKSLSTVEKNTSGGQDIMYNLTYIPALDKLLMYFPGSDGELGFATAQPISMMSPAQLDNLIEAGIPTDQYNDIPTPDESGVTNYARIYKA